MSPTLDRVRVLIAADEVKVSEHGYDELAADQLSIRVILEGIKQAEVIEDYPTYPKGPCVLVLQRDDEDKPIHVLWGIPSGHERPAVLITAYRPDPMRWSVDFRLRKP
ncbi:MAG: DUF4258 domain-containing protein [Planctomycetes bacterium]|nr:DUF4258 domain-containing protein [Planctomycetota bacterium]